MMNEAFQIAGVFGFGLLLGTFFFAALWWTVNRAVSSNLAALLFVASFVVRTAVVLSGFYFVMRAGWLNAFVCLVGFITSRLLAAHLFRTHGSREAEGRYGTQS